MALGLWDQSCAVATRAVWVALGMATAHTAYQAGPQLPPSYSASSVRPGLYCSCDPQPGSQTPESAHPISPAETRGTEKGLRRSSAAVQDTPTRDPQLLIRFPSPSVSPYRTVSSTVTVISPYTGDPSKYHFIISDRPHIWVGIGGRAKGSGWLSDSPGSLGFKNEVRGAHGEGQSKPSKKNK